jgi:hypothetical protein
VTPESRLIAKIAEESTVRISRRVVRDLQQLKEVASGDDSGLENLWDEICVQRQGEESVFWDAYDQTVWTLVAAQLDKTPVTELQAIWLQTDEGENWLIDSDEHSRHIPWSPADVGEYIVHAVYELAGSWSNHRIREFLEKDWCDDP